MNMKETSPKVSIERAVAEEVRGLRYVFGCLVRLSAGARLTDFLYDPRSPPADSVNFIKLGHASSIPFPLLFAICLPDSVLSAVSRCVPPPFSLLRVTGKS